MPSLHPLISLPFTSPIPFVCPHTFACAHPLSPSLYSDSDSSSETALCFLDDEGSEESAGAWTGRAIVLFAAAIQRPRKDDVTWAAIESSNRRHIQVKRTLDGLCELIVWLERGT